MEGASRPDKTGAAGVFIRLPAVIEEKPAIHPIRPLPQPNASEEFLLPNVGIESHRPVFGAEDEGPFHQHAIPGEELQGVGFT